MKNKQLRVNIPEQLYTTLNKLRDSYMEAGLDITRKDLISILLLEESHLYLRDLKENNEAVTDMKLKYIYYKEYYK